jgi:hypothetical protein
MFYMADQDTIRFANDLVADASSVIGYSLCVYLSAIGENTIHGRTVHLGIVAQCLRDLKGWRVVESQYQNVLEIRFEIEGDDQEKLQQCIDEVEKVAISLSLANQLGFAVACYSPGPKYRGQPFAITAGIEERLAKAISATDIEQSEQLASDERCRMAAHALQTIYSQVTPGARLIKGFAALEKVLQDDIDSGLEHILDGNEIEAVINAVNEIFPKPTDKAKRDKLDNVIRDKGRLAKKNRNQRMADVIARILEEDEGNIFALIQEISKIRGKHAHEICASVDAVDDKIKLIERVLWAHIHRRQVKS